MYVFAACFSCSTLYCEICPCWCIWLWFIHFLLLCGTALDACAINYRSLLLISIELFLAFFFFLLQTMLLWMLVTCTSLHSKCKGFSRTHCWFHSVHDFAVTRWCQIVFQNGYINLRFKKSLEISIVSHSSQDLVLPDFLIFANLVNIK